MKMPKTVVLRALLFAVIFVLVSEDGFVEGFANVFLPTQQLNNERVTFINSAVGRISGRMNEQEQPLKRNVDIQIASEQNIRGQQMRAALKKEKLMQEKLDIQQTIQRIRSLTQPGNQAWTAYLNQLNARQYSADREERLLNVEIQNYSQALRRVEDAKANAEGVYKRRLDEDARDKAILDYLISEWKADQTQQNWLALLRRLTKVVNAQKINCNVTIKLNDRNNTAIRYPDTGIVIKYQREEEAQAYTAPALSGNLTIGYYYFWIERNGGPIRDSRRLHSIVNQSQTINVKEN